MSKNIKHALPFRLTIGVTGHRTLGNTSALRATVQKILDDVITRYPGTGKTPVKLCCLSPLAEGADRLVAQEVLRHKESTLKAVLPLTLSDYLKDFKTPESRKEFDNLLNRSRSPHSLRKKSLADEYPQDLLSEARSLAYEQVGTFIVENCDILIIIWDGQKARGRAGTANILRYAETHHCPRYIIRTDRPQEFEFVPGNSSIDALLAKVDTFNTQKQPEAERNEYIQSVYDELFSRPEVSEGKRLTDATKELVKRYLIPFYVDASSQAKQFQRIYRMTGLTVFWLAFAAVVLVGTGAIFWHAPPVIFIVEFFILSFIALLLFYADKIKRSHKNWMEYRFLTERIRAAFFLAICGTEPEQMSVSRRSGNENNSQAWMGIVFEEILNRLPQRTDLNGKDHHLLKDFIDRAWIDDQIHYHDRTYKKNSSKSKNLEKLGNVIFYIAITVAITHVIAPALFSWFHNWFVENTLTLIALLLPTLGATVESIRSHRTYKHIARRSRHMYFELTKLKNTYQLYHPDMLERYVLEAEQMMLSESEEWVLALMSFAELYKAV